MICCARISTLPLWSFQRCFRPAIFKRTSVVSAVTHSDTPSTNRISTLCGVDTSHSDAQKRARCFHAFRPTIMNLSSIKICGKGHRHHPLLPNKAASASKTQLCATVMNLGLTEVHGNHVGSITVPVCTSHASVWLSPSTRRKFSQEVREGLAPNDMT